MQTKDGLAATSGMTFFPAESNQENVAMIDTGALIPDAAAWEQFLSSQAACVLQSSRPMTSDSFPCIAFVLPGKEVVPGGLEMPYILVVRRTELLRMQELPDPTVKQDTEIIDGNDFSYAVPLGVRIFYGQEDVYRDARGSLMELARSDVDGQVAMTYASLTTPRCTRGPHEHRHQTDRFLFLGDATVWLWDNRPQSATYRCCYRVTAQPMTKIVVPPGVVHAYRNQDHGVNLAVVNAPDCLYKGQNREFEVDEIRHEQDPATLFKPW